MAVLDNKKPAAELLFVYGTLRAACNSGAHQRYLQEARFVANARVRGHLYQASYAPALIYPALVLDDVAGWVLGEVYQLTDAAQLAALDAYEECDYPSLPEQEYQRLRVMVTCEQANPVVVWTYAYQRPVAGLRLIASGDFLNPKCRLPAPINSD